MKVIVREWRFLQLALCLAALFIILPWAAHHLLFQLFVQLFYFQGLPIEDVASTIGITTNAAYVRKMRLHEKLRKILGMSGGGL